MLRDLQIVFQFPYHKVHYSAIRHLERLFLLEAPPKIDLGETKKIIVELDADKQGRIGLSEAFGFATIWVNDFEIGNYERFSATEKQEYIVRTLSTCITSVLKNHGLNYDWIEVVADKIRKGGYSGTYQSKPKMSKSRKLKAELSWWYASENCGIKAKVTRKKVGVIFEEIIVQGLSTMELETNLRETGWNGENLICAGTRYSFSANDEK